ncbi:MAG: hypothetical protein Q9227_004930 [Pyrenula ochraceoflavens]
MGWIAIGAVTAATLAFAFYRLAPDRRKDFNAPREQKLSLAEDESSDRGNIFKQDFVGQETNGKTEKAQKDHTPESNISSTPSLNITVVSEDAVNGKTDSTTTLKAATPASAGKPTQTNGQISSPYSTSMAPPPPRLAPPTFGSMPPPPRPTNRASAPLRPPPSAASTLRAPPRSSNTSLSPSSTLGPPLTATSTKPSRKVILSPGHSPLDWAALARSPNASNILRGPDLPPRLIRVPPSLLHSMNGRKGKPSWTSYMGRVYNVTAYLPFHPGGEGELRRAAGRDAEKLFREVHPWVNWEGMLSECCVGVLVPEGEGEGQSGRGREESEMESMD